MWYEKNEFVLIINSIIACLVVGILYFTFGINLQLFIIICLYVCINVYNSIVAYNRAIDDTVQSLAKYYSEAIKTEIKETVKKVLKYQGPTI